MPIQAIQITIRWFAFKDVQIHIVEEVPVLCAMSIPLLLGKVFIVFNIYFCLLSDGFKGFLHQLVKPVILPKWNNETIMHC